MNSKYMAFGALSLSLLLAMLALSSICVPWWQEYRTQGAELSRYRSLTSASSNYDNLRTELQRTHGQLEAKLSVLTSGLGDAADLSALLQMLIGKAREADIRFVRMEPQQQSIGTDFIRYPVVLDMTTTYHSLGRFISAMEATPQSVRVNRLAMSATVAGTLNVRVLVTCFLHRGS
jgi:Tfp pilus assembly protein PilO